MQRAILLIAFLLSALGFVSAQARMGVGRASAPATASTPAAAAPTRTASPAPVAVPSQFPPTPTNTASPTDTIGQPVGSTPSQGTTAPVGSTPTQGTTGQTTTTTTAPPSPVAFPGQVGVPGTFGAAGGGMAGTGQSATMAAQTGVSMELTAAQVVGIGNFGGTDSAWSAPVNQQNLADAAREARQKIAKDHPRVFTNDDVARLRRAAGEPGLVTNEQTMPASDVPAPNTSTPQSNPGRRDNMQNNMPPSDQTTPPVPMNQNQQRPSPFKPKQ